MILYAEADSLGSHRVRFMLAEKNLPVELILVDPTDPPEDLIHLNPYTSLPTLVDRELVLYDAGVVMEYLDERYPHPPMMPVEPVARGKARLAMYRLEKDWYSLIPAILAADSSADKAKSTLVDSLTAAASVFELKPFFLSDDISLLDISLAPFLWRLPRMGVALPAEASAVTAYAEQLFARPGFDKSLSDVERAFPRPDAPGAITAGG